MCHPVKQPAPRDTEREKKKEQGPREKKAIAFRRNLSQRHSGVNQCSGRMSGVGWFQKQSTQNVAIGLGRTGSKEACADWLALDLGGSS